MSCCCSPLGPGSGGGGDFAPIQQVRYLDPLFAGTTSTGSIAEPFKLFSEFFAALTGPFGWGLWLPGGPPMVEAVAVPAFLVGDVAFLGLDREITVIETLTIGEQDADRQITFENVSLPLLTLETGTHQLDFRHCNVIETVTTGALNGRCRLVDCYAATLNLGTDMPLEFSGGTLDSGTTSFQTGQFENVKFLQGAALVPGAGTTTFVGCNFAEPGITISNANAPTLVMDAYSFASFIESSVTFVGTVRVRGVLRGVTSLVSVLVPAQDTAFQDFAIPGLTASHRVIVNVNSDPTTSGIGIAGAWATPSGNNLRVGFINAKSVDVLADGFSLVYWATL